MIIHQAVFGPKKGHAFLEGSCASMVGMFRDVAWLTDLPQTAPSGVKWSSFLRLVRHDKHLLLIFTTPHSANTRAGMVFSRVAFIPLENVEHLHDLSQIATALRGEWSEGKALSPIEIDTNISPVTSTELDKLAQQIASALGQRVERPLVVIGPEGFEGAMLSLWTRVPKEYRTSLLFGLSFGPDDVRGQQIVCTPKELWARWDQKHQIDRTDEAGECSHASILLNLPSAEAARKFADEIQLELNSPTAIKIALRAFELSTNSASPSDDIVLLRILAERSKPTNAATAVKAKIIARLTSSVSNWSAKDVLSLRNIDLAGMSAVDRLSDALSIWMRDVAISAARTEIVEIYQAWAAEKATSFWLSSMASALKYALAHRSLSYLLDAIWVSMATLPHDRLRPLVLTEHLDDMPARLLNSAPEKINRHLADLLVGAFRSRDWWDGVGLVLARSRPAKDALVAALEYSPGSFKKSLLTHALSAVSDEELIEVALANEDDVALDIAAEVCVRNPTVLVRFNWLEVSWFKVFGKAYKKSDNTYNWLQFPTDGIKKIIEAGINDAAVWRVIADTPLSNIIDVPNRENAWNLIPGAYLENIASFTASCWIERYDSGTVQVLQLENYLLAFIRYRVCTGEHLIAVLNRSPNALQRYLSDFGFLSELEAQNFITGMLQSGLQLSYHQARAVGAIFNANRWYRVTSKVKDNLYTRLDFRPLMQECLSLLNYFERIVVGFNLGVAISLSIEEAWTAFEKEAIALYPRGPSEGQLWSRSGGRIEDLDEQGNGRAMWHRIVLQLRSGKEPGVHALLSVMLEDFSRNDTLKQLARHDFWGNIE